MSPPSRAVVVALIFVGVVAVVSVPVAGTPGHGGSLSQTNPDQFGEDPVVSFDAELQTDGDAQWNITTVVLLDSESEIEAYRSTAEKFENGDLPPLGYRAFKTGMADVNQQTSREMNITGFRLSTSTASEIEDGVGRFSVEFTWKNFTKQTKSELIIDRDVLVMDNGNLWLPRLSRTQTLNITAPSEYGVLDANVGAEGGQLQWEGPVTFDESSLQATFIGTGGSNGADSADDGDDGEQNSRSSAFLWLLIPVVAIVIAVAVLLTQRDQIRLDLPTNLDVQEALQADTAGASTEQETHTDGSPSTEEPTVEQSDTSDEDEDQIDTELLSDEERVERLLSSNGGRMKQADIVKETDWSNAKVSQLLSSMEEDDQIDKLRIGRENLISFPDENVTDTDEE